MLVTEDTIQILLVEDDKFQVELEQEILERHELPTKVNVVYDGTSALKYLRKEGEYKQAETPHLVLMDLNMPHLSGFDVLKEIKKEEKLRNIPVIMLTSSTSDEDIVQAYQFEAIAFITKPFSFKKFYDAIEAVKTYLQNGSSFSIISGRKGE